MSCGSIVLIYNMRGIIIDIILYKDQKENLQIIHKPSFYLYHAIYLI